jgi:adenylate cyclase
MKKRLRFQGLFILGLAIFQILLTRFFYNHGIIWPFLQMMVLLGLYYIFILFVRYFGQKIESNFFKNVLSHYTNISLQENIAKKPETFGRNVETKTMTVLFSDIRGFTSMTEKLSHKQLIDLLNQYLDQMGEVIQSSGGIIDKFIGDAIMAFWNGPTFDPLHEAHAIKAAVMMKKQLDIFNKKHKEFPELRIGVGINSGEMIVGNIGSKDKFDYTVMGDNVNLASRLEGLTKKYGVPIIISDTVINGMSKTVKHSLKKDIIFRQLDEVIVKGKSSSVKIFEPLMLTELNYKLAYVYKRAFTCYQRCRFDEALRFFSAIKNDPPTEMMKERIEKCMHDKKQRKSWNGVWAWMDK